MEYVNEREFIRNYNKVYGEILGRERRKRGISLDELSAGILSRTALDKVERGIARWTKLAGDTLMLRMGILPDYFESLASGEELDQWRMREDICLLVPARSKEAVVKLKEYRQRYRKRTSLEEQFLLKAEVFLMLAGQNRNARGQAGEFILDKARQAVGCTVGAGWEKELRKRRLSPGELEAVLLVGAALAICGRREEAWILCQSVWNYPKEHRWKERALAFILPQAAILGIDLAAGNGEKSSCAKGVNRQEMSACSVRNAYAMGTEALELLRRTSCHCYALPLLDRLCGLAKELPKEKESLERFGIFRGMFRELYEWYDYPGYRIWQGISVDNTREVGLVLGMLRKFYGKSCKDAVYDGMEQIVTPRQLEKIEKGTHKPSFENYNRLIRQYRQYMEWNMPLLETESADVLELRQQICTLIEKRDWERAQWEIEKLRGRVDPRYPRVRQEMLSLDAIMLWKKEGATIKCLEMMLEALRCTVPDFGGKDMKWWTFQREEIMIACNIAVQYRLLGEPEESGKWFEAVIFSVEQNGKRTGIYHYGFEMLLEDYSNLLGDIQCFSHALEINDRTIQKALLLPRINGIQHVFYHIAWNAREEAANKPEEYESFRQEWGKAFYISDTMAEFAYDTNFKALLDQRKEKYRL